LKTSRNITGETEYFYYKDMEKTSTTSTSLPDQKSCSKYKVDVVA